MTTSREPMTVQTYGFNVPCRRFVITTNVTREKRLPVVDEFYLRALMICDRISVRRLGSYFGFSETEIEMVTADLVAAGLVEVQGDAVALHPSARQMFKVAEGNVARITEIETWVEHVWFDLVSRNMMTPERTRSSRNLIEIASANMARDMPSTFARKAFEQNFADYMRNVRRLPNADSISLYSISDVEPGRFGYVVVKGRQDLLLEPAAKLQPYLLEVDASDTPRYRPLSDALWDSYNGLTSPRPSGAALVEFERLTGDQTVSKSHLGKAHFDVVEWYDRQLAVAERDRQPIVGATYLDRNMRFFLHALEQMPRPLSSRPIELTWLRPVGTTWGATPDLEAAITNIRGAIRRHSRSLRIRTRLYAPHARGENNMRFERTFDAGYQLSAGILNPAVEVLLISGMCAAVTVQMGITDEISVPIGFVMFGPKRIAALESRLKVELAKDTSALWERDDATTEDEEPSNQTSPRTSD
jgi:hypothetical protein